MSQPRDTKNGDTQASFDMSRTRALVFIGLISALIIVGRSLIHIPLKIPGHTGIFWMALLVIGKGVVKKPTAGTMIGLITGIVATVLIPGKEGLLTGVKYLAPGVTLDLVAPLVGGELSRPLAGALAGGLAHMAKLFSALIMGVVLGIPAGFLTWGLGVAALSHAVFGVLGGWLGAFVLGRLKRAGVLRPEPEKS